MYDITQSFLDKSQSYGRQQNPILRFNDFTLEGEDIFNVSKNFEGDMYRTVMQEVKGEIKGRRDLTNLMFNFSYGLSLDASSFEYIDFGNFIVKEHERIIVSETEDKTTFLAYDSMLLTHTLYDVEQLGITYPCTLFELYQAIGVVCGVPITETSIPNGSTIVHEDKWTNIEDVTYRNILDEIAQITGTSIIIKNNKLFLKEYKKNTNLIPCDDFSCFTPYSGSEVEVRKTFPIDIFKGGRNYWSKTLYNRLGSYDGISVYRYKKTTLKPSTRYSFSLKLKEGEEEVRGLYLYIGDEMNPNISGFQGSPIVQNGVSRANGQFTGRENKDIYVSYYPTNLEPELFDRYEITLNELPTGFPSEYSPAPEDGYGLDLPNGAWHMEGQGNFSIILDLPNAQSSVDVHNWGDATLNGETLVLNETTHYTGSESQLDFNGELDFIASDAFIGVAINDNFNTIDENKMKSLAIKDKILPFNILNLTREQAHDNYVHPLDWETIPVNERSEIVFPDNQIVDKNREDFAPLIYNQIKDITFAPFESNSIGTLHFEPLDYINVVDMNGVEHVSYVSNSSLSFTSGSNEVISSIVPRNHKDKYALITDNRRQFMRVYFLVDQQNGIIEGLVGRVDNVEDEQASLRIEVDEIGLQVSQTHNGNIINNLNGLAWYLDWQGGSVAQYVYENLNPPIELKFQNLRYNIGFVFMEDLSSLNGIKMSIYGNGYDISPKGFIANDGNLQYSYRAKVVRFKPFNIEVLEYEEVEGVITKRTMFNFNSPMAYIQFTLDLQASTRYVALQYNRTGVSPSDRLELSEQMFNRGMPKEWFETPGDVQIWAQSQINILNNEIELKVNVDGVISAINLTSEQAKILARHISLEGLTTINGHFRVLENGDVEFVNARGTNVDLSGKLTTDDLTATGGTIGGFDINGDSLVGDTVELQPNQIIVGTSSIENTNESGLLGIGGSILIGHGTTGSVGQRIDFSNNGVRQIYTMLIGGRRITRTDSVIPVEQNVGLKTVGDTGNRYDYIYLANQPNVSSDARYKSNVGEIDPLLIEIVGKNVKPKMYNSKYDDKLHFGYIAQDVETAFYKYFYKVSVNKGMNKLEASRYAQTLIKQFALLNKDAYSSLLYGELNVIIEAYNRLENDRLNERLNKLEELLKKEGR